MGNESGKHAAPAPEDKAERSVKRMSVSMQRRLELGVDFNSACRIGGRVWARVEAEPTRAALVQ